MKHTELASLGGKARWEKVKSKKKRSEVMKKVRRGEKSAEAAAADGKNPKS